MPGQFDPSTWGYTGTGKLNVRRILSPGFCFSVFLRPTRGRKREGWTSVALRVPAIWRSSGNHV